MPLNKILRALGCGAMRMLRFLFQDKRFGGQDFRYLKVRNGMLYIDEESEAWKNMLPKNYQPPYVDDLGRIVLPKTVCRHLKNSDRVDYWKFDEDNYVVLVTKIHPKRSKLLRMLDETPKDSRIDGWH